jgi:hypothetical protein
MADSTRVRMKWTYIGSISATGTYEIYFSGNSINDPGAGLSTTYPVGWTQWNAFYYKYHTLGSHCKLQIMVGAGTMGTGGFFFSLYPANINTGVANEIDAAGQPYARTTWAGTVNGNNKGFLNNRISTAKVYGQKTIQDDNFAALFSANPTNEWFWMFNAYDILGTSTGLQFQYQVTITYDVLLFERKSIVQTDSMINDVPLRQIILGKQKHKVVDEEKSLELL